MQARVVEVERDLGPIERLTHAAGIMPSHAVMDTTLEQARRLMEVNYFGTLHLLRAVGVPAERVHVGPNIVETPPAPAAPAGPVVGCVGRLVAIKRFESVIGAMPAVRASVPGARLGLVGDGPCRARLEDAAGRVGIAGSVTFTGAGMVLGSLPRLDPAMRRLVRAGGESNQIGIKNRGGQVPSGPFNSQNLPKNRHETLFLEFGISALSARGPVIMLCHDHANTTTGAEFLCQDNLAAFDFIV